MFITDIHSLGVEQFEGTQFTDAWYWNFDEKNKAWADKFQAKAQTRPSFAHAANYSAALNYLEAVQGAGTDASDDVVVKARGQEDRRRLPAQRRDPQGGPPGRPRRLPGQGQGQGQEVKEEWDFEEVVSTIPAEEAFNPVSPDCKM